MDQRFDQDSAYDEGAGEIDLGALGRALLRKRRWIVIPTLAAVLAMGAYVIVTKPMYTADAEVLLENQENFAPRPPQAPVTDANFEEQFVGSQIQLLTSRDIAKRAIAKLGLVGNPEFDPAAKGIGALSRILVLFGVQRDPTGVTPEDRVVDTFEKRLTVFSPLKTRVLTIEFQSHDPVTAARVANELVALYLETQSDAKREQAKTAAAALSGQIADLRRKLTDAADAVERYRTTSGLLAGSNNMTVSGQQLVDLNTEISKARTEEADAQAKAALIREMIRTGKLADIADVANNDLVRRIGEQSANAKAQLALESRTLLPEHPRIKELNAQIAGLDEQLRAAAVNAARTLETNARIAAARVANLQSAIDQQKTQVARSNVDEVHLRELERVAQSMRDQLDNTMAKYQEALARETSPATPADARVIARAVPPDQPTFPKKGPMLAFAAVAGLAFPTAGVVASELLGGSGSGSGDLPQGPDPRGSTPSNPRRAKPRDPKPAKDVPIEPAAPAWGRPHEASRNAMGRAVTGEERGARIVATCVADSEMASQALIGFARSLGRDGRPILLDLDADSGLANLLKSEDGPRFAAKSAGLTDLLAGDAGFADVIHRDSASRLHFIGFGSGKTFRAEDLDTIFEALAQTYDFIVLGATSLAVSDAAIALVPFADVVVLVGTGATRERCEKARAELLEAGAPEVNLIGQTGKPRRFHAA